jgi:pilus assembly protein Flp/PilA
MTDFLPAICSRLFAVLGDKKGVTVVEYGVLLALILAISVGIVATLGNQVLAAFTAVSGALPAAGG